MRFGISNLFEQQMSLLQYSEIISGLDCIDWAPTVSFGEWKNIFENKPIDSINLKLELSALQSIFFGVNGANLLSSSSEFEILYLHMRKLIELCEYYKVKFILWGAPGTRKYNNSGYFNEKLVATRIESILQLFDNKNVVLLMEAVSSKFGCQFLNQTSDLIRFYNKYKDRNIGLHFDVGQMIDEGVNVLSLINEYKSELVHIHLSSPDYSYNRKYNELFEQIIDLFSFNDDIDIVIEIQNIDNNCLNQLRDDLNFFIRKINAKPKQ